MLLPVDYQSFIWGQTPGRMEWNENGYTFYVDGIENGHIDQFVSKRPEFILISTEVQGYRHENHLPCQAAFDLIGKGTFIVDYVRVFDRIG